MVGNGLKVYNYRLTLKEVNYGKLERKARGKRTMNAGIFSLGILTAIAVAFWIYTETPSGKRWIKNL